MKHRRQWIPVLGLAAILFFRSPLLSCAVEDAIIAVVNDEVITLQDLKDYARSTYVSLVAEGRKEAEIKAVMQDMEKDGLNKLIEDKLIISEANGAGLQIREKMVDERIAQMKAKYNSDQDFVDALVKNGATITDLRNKIRDQLKIRFIIDHKVRSKIYVNPQEVTDYYAQHKEQFGRKERVNLESIFIGYGNDKLTAFAKATKALKEIEGGVDFKDIARKYSDTPSIGVVKQGQFLPKIEQTVFNLNIGQVSPLIEVDNGIYIFKLAGKIDAQTADLEDVKETIHDLLFREKFKERFLKWLKELKDKAYVEIKS